MKDRFTAGFVAGLIAAIPMNALSFFNYYVTHFVKLRYLDFAGYMIFGRLPGSLAEVVFSQIAQIGFCGVVGASFAYFILAVSDKNILFKGAFWGTGSWFVFYSLMVLARIPVLSKPSFGTALWQFISSCLYGVILAYIFVWIQHRTITAQDKQSGFPQKYRIVPHPARKNLKKNSNLKAKKGKKIKH